MKNKVAYHASVQNEAGAWMTAGSGRNLNELKAQIRREFGPGWKVIITKVEGDGDSNSWFEPVEVASFTTRK